MSAHLRRGQARLLLGLSLGLSALAGRAQTLPDAGSTLRNATPPAPPLPNGAAAIHVEQAPRAPLEAGEGVRFPVSAFRICGNSLFSSAELLALVQDVAGGERSLGEVEAAAARITSFYRARGYLIARAYVPAQDIVHGVVEIAVLEGEYGELRFANRSRLRDAALQAYFAPARIGRVVNEPALERAMLLAQDATRGGPLGADLGPGLRPGSSDVVVRTDPGAAWSGRLEADNSGILSTGRNRLGGALLWNNPAGYGEQLELRWLTSARGQDYARLAYAAPVGAAGSALGLAYAESRYRLGGPLSALQAYGRASIVSAHARHALTRARLRNLSVELSVDHKRLVDHVDAAATVTDKTIDLAGFGLDGDRSGADGALSSFNLRIDAGRLRIGSAEALAVDQASAHSAGTYLKASYVLTHYQPLAPDALIVLSCSGQQANRNLDSAEKMSLGGPSGVRAYPAGEAAGDAGWLLSAELRFSPPQTAIPGQLTLSGFLDSGQVRVSTRQFLSGENHPRLSGAGIGVTLGQPRLGEWRIAYAHQLGAVPPAADRGRKGRFWIQAAYTF